MSFLVVKDIVKDFGKNQALKGVNIELESNRQYAISGSSGCGKSTLLYLLGGLDRPTSGEITIDGQKLSELDDASLAKFRNESVGFIFQFHFLLPSMNCMDNILLPGKIGGKELGQIKELAQDLAERLGVSHCLSKFPFELSGGEQQRINIIRALSLRPKLLLCDEPTGNLDSKNSETVAELLKELSTQYEATLVVVTHDKHIASMFDEQLEMKDGLFCEKEPMATETQEEEVESHDTI
jgi:ABC-type lipoprotein export system ATPase subunit